MTATKPNANPVLISDRRRIRTLVSPVRQEIVDALEASGPCAIADLAGLLGRRADALYFHVRQLLRVGLLVELPPRASGRRPAAIYDLPGRPVSISRAPEAALAARPVIAAALRLGTRDVTRALADRAAQTAGPLRTLTAGRCKGWLNSAELRRVNALLDEVIALVRRPKPARGRSLQALVWGFAPSGNPRIDPHRTVPGVK